MTKYPKDKQEVVFEYVDVNKLVEDPTNPNIMGEEEEVAVTENIKEFGFLVPVVINENYEVADGEHRIKIAKFLGYEKVPCIKSNKLNDDIARRIVRQSLNKIRGEHDTFRDISELEMIFTSQYKGAAQILQRVALVGKSQFDEMKRIISTAGIPRIGGQFTTETDSEGRSYDKIQESRKAESYLTNTIKQIMLFFTPDQYEIVLKRMEQLAKEFNVKSNTDIFMKLIEHYDSCSAR